MSEDQQKRDRSFATIWFGFDIHFFGNGLTEGGTPHQEAYDFYDRLLSWMDVTKMGHFDIILVLRSLSRMRKHIPSYEGLLLAAKEELDNRGEDSENILRGLFKT